MKTQTVSLTNTNKLTDSIVTDTNKDTDRRVTDKINDSDSINNGYK